MLGNATRNNLLRLSEIVHRIDNECGDDDNRVIRMPAMLADHDFGSSYAWDIYKGSSPIPFGHIVLHFDSISLSLGREMDKKGFGAKYGSVYGSTYNYTIEQDGHVNMALADAAIHVIALVIKNTL